MALESVLYAVTQSHGVSISILFTLMLAAPIVVKLFYPETSGLDLDVISPERESPGTPPR